MSKVSQSVSILNRLIAYPPRRAAGQAASDDVITYSAASEWIEDLEASSTSGGFLLSITIFTVVATEHFQAEDRSH